MGFYKKKNEQFFYAENLLISANTGLINSRKAINKPR